MIISHFDKLRREKSATENRDLPLRTIAEETGVSVSTIQRFRKEKQDSFYTSVLEAFCKYFAVSSLCDLIEWKDGKE